MTFTQPLKSRAFLLLFALLTFPSTSFSAGACKADREKFCGSVPAGHGERIKCLKSHESELSTECKAHIEERKQRHQAIKQNCGADRQKFCGNVQPGQGRIRQCMKDHEKELSSTCRSTLQAKK